MRVTSTAICGSDLHLLDGYIPSMEKGDILGHEFMGEIVEVGRDVKKVKVGDRVIMPFNLACGVCEPCQRGLFSACDNSNPNHRMAEALYGATSASGLFGYSHLFGGYASEQAQFVRVPFLDVSCFPIPVGPARRSGAVSHRHLPDRISGGRELRPSSPGRDVVAVFGAGPVGQFAARSAQMLGAA